MTFAVPTGWLTVSASGPASPSRSAGRRRSGGPTRSAPPLAARPGSACGRWPGGAVSGWLVREVRAGDVMEVLAPSGTFTPDLPRGGEHVLIAAGSGITPVLSIAASVLAAQPIGGHAGVRQSAQRHGDVRRRGRRPEGRLSRPGCAWCTCCPANRRRSSCSTAGSTPASCASCCPRRSRSRPSTTGGCAGRSAWSPTPSTCSPTSDVAAAGSTGSCSTSRRPRRPRSSTRKPRPGRAPR